MKGFFTFGFNVSMCVLDEGELLFKWGGEGFEKNRWMPPPPHTHTHTHTHTHYGKPCLWRYRATSRERNFIERIKAPIFSEAVLAIEIL